MAALPCFSWPILANKCQQTLWPNLITLPQTCYTPATTLPHHYTKPTSPTLPQHEHIPILTQPQHKTPEKGKTICVSLQVPHHSHVCALPLRAISTTRVQTNLGNVTIWVLCHSRATTCINLNIQCMLNGNWQPKNLSDFFWKSQLGQRTFENTTSTKASEPVLKKMPLKSSKV